MMARKKVKAEEVKDMVPEEVVVADVIKEEEPVVVAEEHNGLLDTVVEETKHEDISAETAECNSLEPVDVGINVEDVSNDTKEETQDSNESLPGSIEDKEVVPVNAGEEEIQQEDVSEATAECNSLEPVDVEINVENKETIPTVFRSASEEVRYYILEMLKDGKSHKKKEIVAYITERSGKTFSEAVVINVLRNLTSCGSLISLERGSYSIGMGTGLTNRLIKFIEVTRNNLEKVATISVCDMQEEDYKAISELKQLKETLNNMYERLASN